MSDCYKKGQQSEVIKGFERFLTEGEETEMSPRWKEFLLVSDLHPQLGFSSSLFLKTNKAPNCQYRVQLFKESLFSTSIRLTKSCCCIISFKLSDGGFQSGCPRCCGCGCRTRKHLRMHLAAAQTIYMYKHRLTVCSVPGVPQTDYSSSHVR